MSPVKYPSLADETDAKNFFPVTWRVIGGGVRVGVAKENGRDLILHENGNAFEHSISSQLPPLKLPNRKRSNSIPPTPSNSLFNVEQVRYSDLLSNLLLITNFALITSYFPQNLPVSCKLKRSYFDFSFNIAVWVVHVAFLLTFHRTWSRVYCKLLVVNLYMILFNVKDNVLGFIWWVNMGSWRPTRDIADR